MGATGSKDVTHEAQLHGVVCISVEVPNKIRVLQGDIACVEAVRQSIVPVIGEVDEYVRHGALTFKMPGFPFDPSSVDTAMGRSILGEILGRLQQLGWSARVSTDTTRLFSGNAVYLRRAKPMTSSYEMPDMPLSVIISLRRGDRLQVFNAPSHLKQLITDVIQYMYTPGVLSVEDRFEGVLREFRLSGHPWHADGSLKTVARIVLLHLVKEVSHAGFTVFTSINLKDTVHSLYFMQSIEPAITAKTSFFLFSLDEDNLIRLIGAPDALIGVFGNTIRSLWRVLEQGLHAGAYEFKLMGAPWLTIKSADAIQTRSLLCNLFEMMYSEGYKVYTRLDVARNLMDKAVFFMQSCDPFKASVICVSMCSRNKLRFINCPSHISSLILSTLERVCVEGCKETKQSAVPEIQLGGHPWSKKKDRLVTGRNALCCILSLLEERFEYILFCSVDVGADMIDDQKASDCHSWFFVHFEDAIAQKQNNCVAHHNTSLLKNNSLTGATIDDDVFDGKEVGENHFSLGPDNTRPPSLIMDSNLLHPESRPQSMVIPADFEEEPEQEATTSQSHFMTTLRNTSISEQNDEASNESNSTAD